MPSHSTHISYYTRPACMGLVTLKIPNFAILICVAGLTPSRRELFLDRSRKKLTQKCSRIALQRAGRAWEIIALSSLASAKV
jgi:hypothetical protein